MSLRDSIALRVVLYEGSGARLWPAAERLAVVTALLEKGFAVTRTGADRRFAAADGGPFLLLGRFADNGPPPMERADGAGGFRFQDVTGFDVPRITELVEAMRGQAGAARPGDWKPWFPVIDYDRCTNCMQCLSFCLFGVYGVSSDQRIQVQNHDNCKTNCPACSRVCPEAAIMFPKYKAGPINGEAVSAADLQREKMKVDISALLGGDVYALLRERSEKAKSRFSKERDADKALGERKRCLAKLAAAGDIPAEVLMALPSPDEIQRRAQEAMARAQAALAAQR